MKRVLSAILAALMVTVMFTGCAKQVETQADTYKDGDYFAAMPNFDEKGYKYFTSFKVTDGKINSVVFDCVSANAKQLKTDLVKAGAYPMVAQGKAQAEWDVQAKKAADYLVEKQDPAGVQFNEEGKTDAIAGVTIHVSDFFDLAEQALAAGPTTKGPYADGTKHAETKFDDKGWKYTVDVYVLNGNIASVNWDGVDKKGESKTTQSEEGKYGMVEKGGAQAEWHVQAAKAEEYLIKTQNPDDITVNAEGKTDAIAGVSISVNDFVDLAKEALGK